MRILAAVSVVVVLVACGDDDGAQNNNVGVDAGGGCGDGVQDPGEACDDGTSNSDTNPDACRTDCRLPWCGDGVADSNEQCDHGDDNSDTEVDGCRTDCQVAWCGDGVIDTAEACDGDDVNPSCTFWGPDGGDVVVCDGTCQPDLSGCEGCGNTICDDGVGETPTTCPQDCGPRQVDAGADFTCTLLGTQRVYCFGNNDHGQLGSMGGGSTLPVEVTGLTNAVAITAGGAHACAVADDNSAWCWGSNSHGQLGDGTNVDSATPVAVSGLSATPIRLTAGGQHTCALLSDGTAACWGRNNQGQLGNGIFVDSWTPVAVGLLQNVSLLSAGQLHSCAVDTTAGPDVFCWGNNDLLQLGFPTINNSPSESPGLVIGNNAGKHEYALSAGAFHTCGGWDTAWGEGPAYCWGDNSTSELGDDTPEQRVFNNAAVDELSAVSSLATGGYRTQPRPGSFAYHGHTCALLNTGGVHCWGDNSYGQLGDGSAAQSQAPVAVFGLLNVVEVSAGDQHTCCLRSDNTLQCWGANGQGQLGTGDLLDASTPQPVDTSQW